MTRAKRLSALLKTMFGAGISALAFGIATPASAQPTLNVLCAPAIEWCEAIVTAFQRETGIKVAMSRKSAGEILAQVKAEAQNPRVDIWFGGSAETHFVAADDKLLQPYTPPALGDLQPWAQKVHAQSGGACVGVSSAVIGIVFNRDVAARKRFPAPKGWADLIDPAYKGEVQMPNPNSSGTAYTIIAGLIQQMGEDQAFAYLQKLHANINSYTRSGSAPLRAASKGETGVAITFNIDVISDIAKGFPIEYSYPAEGTSYEVACMSIIKGTRNEALAKKFYDWYLTPKAMEIAYAAEQWHLPAHKGAKQDPKLPDLARIKLVDYDFKAFGASATRKRILERWEKEIGSLPAAR